jgi:digeranylgeranylglycerophospholipid reductase
MGGMNIIIGAGPAGCIAAAQLARKGLQVTVHEEHPEIGEPVQCTGIVTSRIERLVKVPGEVVLNRIRTARIRSGKAVADLPVDDIVLDRSGFDRWLADEAKAAGASISTNSRFIGLFKDKAVIKDLAKGKLEQTEYMNLIGADGPASKVAWSAGMYGVRRFMVGRQVHIKGRFEPDMFEAFVEPGSFSWIVPESDTQARMGMMAMDAHKRFPAFLATQKKRMRFSIISHQGGLIPMYQSQRIKYKVKRQSAR